MHVTIGAVCRVACTPSVADELACRWRLDNPEYLQAERAGRWTGHMDEEIWAGSIWPGGVILPRGLAQHIINDGATVDDCTTDLVCDGSPPDPVVTLRDYQFEAVGAAWSSDQGYIVAPCGAGKTTIGLEVIRGRAQKALVLVHTRDLAAQWQGAIKAQLGAWGEANVTVATVQSLWGTAAREPKPLPPHGLLMMDEAHHAPSRCFGEVVGRSTARYRYGLTATPDREDGLGQMLEWTFGACLYTVERSCLLDDGHLIAPRLEMVRTGYKPETVYNRAGDLDWTGIVQQLADDQARTDLVATIADGQAHNGHVVLVLTTRVEHAEAVAANLAARGLTAHVVTGATPAKQRAARLEDVRAGRVRILIATQLADEGLDLPILDVLVLALPSRAFGRTVQRIGRIMRPAPGKGQPVVYDLVDEHACCWGQWHRRRKAFDAAVAR
jgi:superfamily II DNA or RNA helicase